MGETAGGVAQAGQDRSAFSLSVAVLQGRWKHSLIGSLIVRDDVVVFDALQHVYRVVVQPGGSLEVGGWVARVEKCTASKVVWVKDNRECFWEREDAARSSAIQGQARDIRCRSDVVGSALGVDSSLDRTPLLATTGTSKK